jgi:hypothetical protein
LPISGVGDWRRRNLSFAAAGKKLHATCSVANTSATIFDPCDTSPRESHLSGLVEKRYL